MSGDAITVPDFLSNRFHEKKKVILTIAAGFILIFFTVYTASCFVTCGKLFSGLFGFSYHSMMIAGAVFVLIYTVDRRLSGGERIGFHAGGRDDRGAHVRARVRHRRTRAVLTRSLKTPKPSPAICR